MFSQRPASSRTPAPRRGVPASLLGVLAMVLCVVMSATQAAAQYTVTSGQLLWLSKPTGHVQYLRINVPVGTKALHLGVSGATGDVDLYARRFTAPTINPMAPGQYCAFMTQSGSTAVQSIVVNNPPPGVWYIAIHAYQGYTNLKFRATVRLADAQNLWVKGPQGSMQVYSFYVPEGTPRVSFRVSPHNNPVGDPDLFVRRGAIPTYANHTWSATSGAGQRDTVTIENPAAGTYYVAVYAYSALEDQKWILSATTADLNQPLGISVVPELYYGVYGIDLLLTIVNTSDRQVELYSVTDLIINGQWYTFNSSSRQYIQPDQLLYLRAYLPQGSFLGYPSQIVGVSVSLQFCDASTYQSVDLIEVGVEIP